jgi:hypothetical protein
MALVESNSDAEVSSASKAAFDLAAEGKLSDAVKKLSELRGVGPATASGVFSTPQNKQNNYLHSFSGVGGGIPRSSGLHGGRVRAGDARADFPQIRPPRICAIHVSSGKHPTTTAAQRSLSSQL